MRRSDVSHVSMTAFAALTLVLSACDESTPDDSPAGPACGNGIIEMGEMCDWTESAHLVNSATCATATADAMTMGELGCMPGCTAFDTSACFEDPNAGGSGGVPMDGCGDGTIVSPEECEHSSNGTPRFNAGMDSCAAVTMGQMDVGTLGCSAMCRFDMTKCVSSGENGGTGAMGAGGNGAGGTGGGGTGG